jgi:hypothetical protein
MRPLGNIVIRSMKGRNSDFVFIRSTPGSFAATEEFETTTYAVPVAVEIDVTGRVKVFFGAQYRYTDSESKDGSVEERGPTSRRAVLGDGTVDLDEDDGTFIMFSEEDEVESKTSDSFFRAGFQYNVHEHLSLQGLLAASSGGNADRDGVDLDTVFFGVTLYGHRK